MVELRIAIVFGAVAVILIGSIVYLNVAEKKLKAKLHKKREENAKLIELRSNLKKIKRTQKRPSENLKDLDLLAKELFNFRYNLPKHMSYSQLANELSSKSSKALYFAQKMTEAFYSGQEITNRDVYRLANYLDDIIVSN